MALWDPQGLGNLVREIKAEGGLDVVTLSTWFVLHIQNSDILFSTRPIASSIIPLIALNFLDLLQFFFCLPNPLAHPQTHPRTGRVLHPLALLSRYKTVSETEDDNLWFLAVAQWTGHLRSVTLS